MSDRDEHVESKGTFGDSLLGRVMRGEEKATYTAVEETEHPRMRETAAMDNSGRISISTSWYGEDGSKAIANEVCEDPESNGYKEILGRHSDLSPDKPSTYTEYHDGRWVLTRAAELLASGHTSQRHST